MLFVAFTLVGLLLTASFAASADILSKLSATKLNVHLVAHSHDDPGWLKTADQYFTGSNSSIYRASVQYIFNSVIDELKKAPERKFTMCEISFFERWWNEQDEFTKATVRRMIQSGQLSFVNGGWVMHDEASAHYVSMIDQTTLGHQFLLKELNYRPRVGWQIDPFGHSNTHSWLSSEVGFDALFFGRIDYQDRAKRMSEQSMEFIWRGSKSQSDAEVFTGAFSDGNYAPPKGFCIDTNCPYCKDDPVVSDPLLETYNLDDKVQLFINGILAEQKIARGNNIMLRMGADFVYQNAQAWYRSIDKLIAAINERDPRFNLFYSDPTSYMRARAQETEVVWPSKTDDFFPYSDFSHAFWAGYFTSRPTLKYLERTSASYLQVLKQIASTPGLRVHGVDKAIFKLTAAVGLINHHDAVTGTSKQHVADDYTKILSAALTEAEKYLSFAVGRMQADDDGNKIPSFSVCRMANESVCDSTQKMKTGDSVMVLMYNPLPRADNQQVSLFFSDVVGNDQIDVSVKELGRREGDDGKYLASDLIPTSSGSPNPNKAPYTLIFNADNVPAMGFTAYLVRVVDRSSKALDEKEIVFARKTKKSSRLEEAAGTEGHLSVEVTDEILRASNGIISVTFNRATGRLASLSRGDKTISLQNEIRYYQSFGPHVPNFPTDFKDDRDPHLQNLEPHPELAVDFNSFQPSGAYIFRPHRPNEEPTSVCESADQDSTDCVVELTVVRGHKVIEIEQKFSSWVTQVVRLRDEAILLEFENTIGPIPDTKRIGKEIITRFDTNLHTGGHGQNVFYTDSNGREFMERKYNFRPTWDLKVFEPISGNYYPLSTSMFIKDEKANVQLSILPDRSLGAASLTNGQMEIMVHRRLFFDDFRGVGEPLDETDGGIEPYPTWKRIGNGIVVTGKQYVLLSDINDGMKELRTAMDKIYLPFASFFGPNVNDIRKNALNAKLGVDLPVNVHIVSLEKLPENKLLLRLGHQFAVNEDAVLSQPVDVDVAELLSSYKPISMVETTLSANQDKATQQKDKIQWQYSLESKVVKNNLQARLNGVEGLKVTLQPMQIRTFVVSLV